MASPCPYAAGVRRADTNAGPSDRDALVYRVDQVRLLLRQIGVKPCRDQRVQPLHRATSRQGLRAVGSEVGELCPEVGRTGEVLGVLHCPALVGNIGSSDVRNFTAIGDTTNLAARLQTFAEPGHVVISERTRALIGPADVAPLGSPSLKGKSLPVEVFDLRALLDDPREVATPLEATGS